MAVRLLDPEVVVCERPDLAIVAAARSDSLQFAALYERYFARVHRYVRLRIRDRAACEDVTSDVFLTALAKLGDFRGTGSFAAWLFRIAQNAVCDHQRGRVLFSLDEVTVEMLADPAPGPAERAIRSERLRRVRRLLGELKPGQQDLLALRYGAELRSDEIAEVLGKRPVAVRVALHRTMNELRERYFDET